MSVSHWHTRSVSHRAKGVESGVWLQKVQRIYWRQWNRQWRKKNFHCCVACAPVYHSSGNSQKFRNASIHMGAWLYGALKDPFIHFHTPLSSEEGRGGSSPKTRNVSNETVTNLNIFLPENASHSRKFPPRCVQSYSAVNANKLLLLRATDTRDRRAKSTIDVEQVTCFSQWRREDSNLASDQPWPSNLPVWSCSLAPPGQRPPVAWERA